MKPEGPREWTPRKSQMEKFIEEEGLSMKWDAVPMNPAYEGAEEEERKWADESFHYKIFIKKGRKTFTTYYSMGAALQDPPDLPEVLDSLASDAAGFENNQDFEEWAREYGYDTDSRKAEKIFRLIETQSNKLKLFLGDAAYKKLLWEVERE